MNIATSQSSLFQLTQNLDEPLVSQPIGAETLKSYVSNIIELLIEKQLRVTVWVKLPQTKSWLDRLQKLQEQGNAKHIFLCSSYRSSPVLPLFQANSTKTPVVPIVLEQNSTLQRESFLIVFSDNFCSLVLAQWQKSKIQIDSSGKRLQQPYLEMVSSFAPQAIDSVLAGIKANIISNTSFLTDEDLKTKSDTKVEPDLLGELIFKQVKHNEIIQNKLNPSKTNQIPEQNTTVLGLQEDFLNNLVQELRSPITHMKTALSLLESKQIKGEQRQRYLKLVSDECQRQNSLVNGLLGLLQLDTPIEAEYLRLNEVVPGIVSIYQPLAEEKEIQLGYTISANLPSIDCPLPWFRQILINLLNNSLQFTPAKGRVSVQATKNDSEYVEISVIDTGEGIAEREINKIFDGFYRTKPSTNEKSAGAGLGLTLVQQLIQRCGGSISVNSKVGRGTTFKILMPAVPAELT